MMLYLDNAATTLKKPLSVYATLFKSTLFSGGNAGRGGYGIIKTWRVHRHSPMV